MNTVWFSVLVLAATVSATALASPQATIHYTYWERYDLDIWTGPTSNPIQAYGGNGGVIDVSVARHADGTYDEIQRERYVGGSGTLDSTYRLMRAGNRTMQVLVAQASTLRSPGISQQTTDTYPNLRAAFLLPLMPHDVWSATARDLSSRSIVETSPSPASEQETADRREDGTYDSKVSASDFTSATYVRRFSASAYRLSENGYNTLTQTFALPVKGIIDVASSGNPPLPVKPGTVRIKSWYPYNGGALTQPLLRDRFHVIGSVKIPAVCRRRVNQPATRINEEGYSVDPVRGTASAFVTAYFLTPLSKRTQMIACVVEQYVEGVWANGWAMSAGDWGKLVREQSGERLYIARDVPAGAGEMDLPVVGVDAIAMRRLLNSEDVRRP
jgi:hypothetical protein